MSDNTFTPAVFYRDPKGALAWLQRAFGFEITMLLEDANGTLAHSEMGFAGRGRVMVGAEWAAWTKSPVSVQGANTQSIHVEIETDVDAHCARARSAGANIVQQPETQFFGARTYRAIDPEGHVWTFAQRVADVSREEAAHASGLKIQATSWD
jgi:uncharacterized glyoxalase superfamily protein PhnB